MNGGNFSNSTGGELLRFIQGCVFLDFFRSHRQAEAGHDFWHPVLVLCLARLLYWRHSLLIVIPE